MNHVISYITDLLIKTLGAVGTSLMHNWKILAFAVILAAVLKTYVNSDKLSKLLYKRKRISIFASVAFGAFTPLCACGTTAVIIGMLTTTFPWGPIMAFLTSSPLMSPDGFVMISGIISVKFAVALTVVSLFIGIASGFITNVIEKRTHILEGQSRFAGKTATPACACGTPAKAESCSCNAEAEISAASAPDCSCSAEETVPMVAQGCSCSGNSDGSGTKKTKKESVFIRKVRKFKLDQLVSDLYTLGLKQILFFYMVFVAVGFLINYFIPSSIISVLFGANSILAVPLASFIGLPLYITTDSGIPIIQSMLLSGASEGAMLAFMITGSATSAWVIAGLATFLKKRAIMLYVAFVLFGGIISGYLLDLVNLFLK